MQLREQPALFQRRLRFGLAQRAVEDQGFRFVHRPDRGLDGVATQAPQSAHTLVPVDHHEAVRLAGRHHHDGDLLASLGQRPEQPSLLLRPPHPQSLVAQVELVELQIQVTLARGRPWIQARRADSACQSRDLVLPGRRGKSSPIFRDINELHPDLVLHGPQKDSRHKPNQVSDLNPDLVLRKVPGNSVEGSPHSRRGRAARHGTLRRIA